MSRNSEPAGRPSSLMSQQQFSRDPQAVIDAEAAVEIGIVDEPLPADRGARLGEVHPHHDLELAGQTIPHGAQALRVFHRRNRIMNRARADDDGQPVVAHDAGCRSARLANWRRSPMMFASAGIRAITRLGSDQRLDFADTDVVGRGWHVKSPLSGSLLAAQKKPPGDWQLVEHDWLEFRSNASLPLPGALEIIKPGIKQVARR